jgi:unsaturated chondroitin disaccharide hydrolase
MLARRMAPGFALLSTAFWRTSVAAAIGHYRDLLDRHPDPHRIPRSAAGGSVHLVGPSDWTSGFVAGSLWYLSELSDDGTFETAARAWTLALIEQQHQTGTHDVGFMIHSSFGNGLRLTGDPAYRRVLITAAESLATRFNGRVGALRSWDWGRWSFPVIIDNMMNLELLFRATELGGGARYAEMAVEHALTTDEQHFRLDSSSYHLVDFDPVTGRVSSKETHQGLFDESTWARGQAWALYGFTMAYRETRDARFLARALAVAEFMAKNLPPDGVPYFDFAVPSTPRAPRFRDASAAAITASALLELQAFAPAASCASQRRLALDILRRLGSSDYTAAPATNGGFILLHRVGDQPRGTEVDAALNYADYYYLEALLRARSLGLDES